MNVLTFTAPHMRRTEISTVIIRFNAIMIFTETKTWHIFRNITLEPKHCCYMDSQMLKKKDVTLHKNGNLAGFLYVPDLCNRNFYIYVGVKRKEARLCLLCSMYWIFTYKSGSFSSLQVQESLNENDLKSTHLEVHRCLVAIFTFIILLY